MTKNELLQNVWHKYEAEQEHKPSGTKEAVVRAVEEGLLDLPPVDPYELLARQMAAALREEYAVDEFRRRYRVNHAARITVSGVQLTFWAVMGYAPLEHMEVAFAQRREQIVSDCAQLKTDVDVYNGELSASVCRTSQKELRQGAKKFVPAV